MSKDNKRDTLKAAIVLKTADIVGVTPRYVNYVIDAKRQNEDVMNVYMALLENEEETKNKLLMAVNKLVPFDQL